MMDEAARRRSHAAALAESARARGREVLRDALAEVWSGADFADADAVIDQLSDRGHVVVAK
jgi:hypothetical protein